MNSFLLANSLKYIREHKLITCLSIDIYNELVSINYNDQKLKRSFDLKHYDIAKSIIHLLKDKFILNDSLRDSFSIDPVQYELRIRLLLDAKVGQDIKLSLLRRVIWSNKLELLSVLQDYFNFDN